jgi:1-pyrroline-5-carboxylate dehydrogenase
MPSSRKVKKNSTRASSKAGKVVRITYATLRITPEDDRAYDHAVEQVRAQLGGHFAMYVNGEKWVGTGEEVAHPSPINTEIMVSHFTKGTRDDAKAAVDAAQEAYTKWSETPYKERVKLLRKAADIIVERRYVLSAWMAFELGKNRAESLAEVNEAA